MAAPMTGRPSLSVVVNMFNMRREAQRSLLSLSRGYQRDIGELDYEVIVIDNGSTELLSQDFVQRFGPEFRHVAFAAANPSPAAALNHGVSQARHENVMVMIDGAHILTPRIFDYATTLLAAQPNPFVAAIGLPLGPRRKEDVATYDQAAEDRAVAAADWPAKPYSLFALPGTFGDKAMGWFGCLYESACVTMRKQTYVALGGMDERFRSRGGGLVNLDFFNRVIARNDVQYTVLLGEATFHQYHRGTASNADIQNHPWDEFNEEYARLRGQGHDRIARRPNYFGQFTPESAQIAQVSAQHGFQFWLERGNS